MQADKQLSSLTRDALQIWQAGVDAVRSERLIAENLSVDGSTLLVGDEAIDLDSIDRIVAVGTGKAGTGMAAAVEDVLGPQLMQEKRLTGWVNVPDDCVRELQAIKLHGARPAGVNEPTAAGAEGAAEILRLVESLSPRDLCLCLISGGGSALLPAPVEGISLADKLAVTRFLSAAGANIEELNTVRKQLSSIKGGGLARACGAGRLVSLIISDVLGDPLDVIASGPTVADSSTAAEALTVLERFDAADVLPAKIFKYLEKTQAADTQDDRSLGNCQVTNLVIGNNALAVDAAGAEAERLGYSHAMQSASEPEGFAEDIGRHLAEMALSMRGGPGPGDSGPDCLISGGEPVVKLADESVRGRGGRNQQLVLAALELLSDKSTPDNPPACGIVILSGGTDGEDGPTDAAGAFLNEAVIAAAAREGLEASVFLRRNDAYNFFGPFEALIKTGPTHTNVCDLRVVVVAR
ncbi:MAG: DUF4147 domain-containing protein [Planctomycetota bacterium]|nr:DUF4147 domain-containing protein [Planctomycetota bacterium]